ncbi:hypothetical protein SAMN02910370_01482 [Lachnospiraceae bacterium XPB1003]|nr:hypothetical protein SAMN02910370_01482 [Lachnospiraceae bacterium XPB1003]
MNNSGYVCLMIVLKMLEVRFDSRHIEDKFRDNKKEDTDVAIIKAAKELGLKVKLTVFREKVISRLIVDVGVGNTVRLRVPGYDDTKYEYLDGTITEIGNLSVKVEGLGTVYPVDISVNGIPDDMKQGMEGKMDIIIGTRTVMDYFLEPFRKGLDNSMKEK